MKVFAALLLGASAGFAQRITIGVPQDQATFSAGQSFVVEIDRPNFQSSAQEVSVVIGINSCAGFNGECPSPSDTMGTVLYSGSYNPQLVTSMPFKPPHQNFTVTVPPRIQKGPAQIGVAHFSLIGASLSPFLETKNTSVIIQ
ncbi:hypothetical protein AN958_03294 [Leucoagaricus sp. SymC.cos]|nr:hypothetical protein AN958_03294 [Leucoagaricus sp. SymC.cos]